MDIAIPGYTEGVDYVETFDSPQKTKEKITRKIVARHAIGEMLFDTILTMHGQNGLDASQCSLTSGIYDTLTIVFKQDPETVITFTTGEKVSAKSYSADANGAEHALEERSNYKMCWNHNLYECVDEGGAPSAVPAWATTATDGTNADGIQYLWSNAQPSAAPDGKGWKEVLHRTKKSDAFLFPDFVVHETQSFRNKAAAEKAVAAVGTLKAPGETYGRSSAKQYWLITRSSVSDDNGVYTLQTDYQYSFGGWDEDLYQ
jgi:hypothetical protein